MTPEEKAKDLINRFKDALWENGNPNNITLHANQCAIVCAESVRDQVGHYDSISHAYWQSVLNHLKS